MALMWFSIILFIIGVAAWCGGYLKFTVNLPRYDPLRGMACVPGLLMVLTSIILFCFFWHWVLGTLCIGLFGYGGYRLIKN